MLRVHGIAKSYGPRQLFSDVSFIVNAGDRAAIIGPNGSGKSTVLDIVAGLTPATEGSVTFSPGTVLAYLRQGYEQFTASTVEEAAMTVLPGAPDAFHRLRQIDERLATGDGTEKALDEYQSALDGFESSGAQRIAENLLAALAQVGLDGISPDAPLETLSGGQRSRVALAGTIAARPDLLLLDEPTNHLDLPALEWLEDFMRGFKGAALIVSHDRVFFDNTVTRVLELDPESQTVIAHAGSYSAYVEERDREQAARLQRWRDQEAEIRRVRADIQRMKSRARSLEGKRRPADIPAIMWNPGKIASGMARLARSREAKLKRFEESDERVGKPAQRWQVKLELAADRRPGDMVLRLDGVTAGYAGLKVLDAVQGEATHHERIALMGANGTGKSTLLRIIAGLRPSSMGGVRLGSGVTVGYMPQEHTGFSNGDTPFSIVLGAWNRGSETEARNFLHFFLFQGDHVFTPVERLSYGERARLYLAKLVSGSPNLLLLDEPLNHLDIPSRERFEEALLNYDGTAVAATHDRAFVDSWATAVWWLEPGDTGARLRRYLDRMEMEKSQA